MADPLQLQKAIENLSKKKHVVSEDAIRAKTFIQEQENPSQYTPENIEKQTQHLIEFNKGITLLSDIFMQSQFDELVHLAAQPTRTFLLNFCLGLMRGLGFALGLLLILGLLLYSLRDVILSTLQYVLSTL